MPARVAVLSDIHGVLPALDAVLAEPDVTSADAIVVTGDICSGPQPVAVLDRLLGLGDRVTLVRGNADRELVEIVDGATAEYPIDGWAAGQLAGRPDLVDLIRALPHPVTLDVDGFGAVLFCHGTPGSDIEVVLVDTRPSRWADAFADLPDDVGTVVCGHTHMPFARLVDRRMVVNSGSIGMPYGGTGAYWALLANGGVTLRRSDYDVEAARAAIRTDSDYPDVDEWTAEYLTGRHSDLDALAAFGPRDGRNVSSSAR
jgi:predicted phosphodiesterase